jgi:hypothetical protein
LASPETVVVTIAESEGELQFVNTRKPIAETAKMTAANANAARLVESLATSPALSNPD